MLTPARTRVMSNTLTPDNGNGALLDPLAISARHLLCPDILSEVEIGDERSDCLAAILSAIFVLCA
jgi:hypothetical protein